MYLLAAKFAILKIENILHHSIHCLDVFNTIDYVVEGFKKAVFQTCEKEKGKVVFQMVNFLSLLM
jgi:hypothetical protein